MICFRACTFFVSLLLVPELANQARAELTEERGADFNYTPLLGDRAPAPDYRLKQ